MWFVQKKFQISVRETKWELRHVVMYPAQEPFFLHARPRTSKWVLKEKVQTHQVKRLNERSRVKYGRKKGLHA